ncbi:Dimerisation domain-containing protein [Halogranum gelatinilyticum]|uniref:Dimerisation domain-containing protein n=1 Tax=Halogranum gelatinilyticum TaxID=660521 RepID=A0A1G9TU63_9EURY|nr:methyltransferase [Halogranum gelatinilyticum]SDM51256.1 Dimerisation domain-containing protein [Halogranum gelatinilyticum]
MPVAPNLFERFVMLQLNRAPGPVLDLVGAGGERAVGLALDLGLFEALATGPATLDDVASQLDCEPAGLEPLCDFLTALGYLTRDGNRYATTPMTERWLLATDGVGPWLTFWHEVVFPFWEANMTTAVRTGAPEQTLYEWLDDHPERWQLAHEGFRAAAAVLAPTVVEKVSLPSHARVLDVGGGHGLYAATLADRHTDALVTVFDTEPARAVALETARDAGVVDRFSFIAGDYTTDELGEGYDTALLFNVVHAHDGPENVALFERVRDALVPGGRLYVLDQFDGTGRTTLARATVGFVGLTYLVTLGHRAHDVDDVVAWLAEAGFEVTDRESFLTAPGVSLLVATPAK